MTMNRQQHETLSFRHYQHDTHSAASQPHPQA
jgi:hypothetical protein